MPPSDTSSSPLAPLANPVFRMLWTTWLLANLCAWMNDVAAAWMMTTMTRSPALVALVQTASTMPVFLLGLPSGALADMLDRRRYLIFTQLWVACVASLLCVAVLWGALSAPLLLLLVFANGMGLAMRWPVFSAVVPAVVPRAQLPLALGLNGVAMNASRIVGPLVAGALIAGAGTAWVFVLNAALSVISATVVMRWKSAPQPRASAPEPLLAAVRTGLRFVAGSPGLRAVLARVSLFFFHSSAVVAMLPLLARGLHGGGAAVFTMLLASMGAGAIITVLLLPRLRQFVQGDALVLRGTVLQAMAGATMAFAPSLWVAVPAMFLNGVVWIATVNTLSVAAQYALPDWVRARGMSVYQVSLMGGSALGAALWGQVAALSSVPASLCAAAASAVLCMLAARRFIALPRS